MSDGGEVEGVVIADASVGGRRIVDLSMQETRLQKAAMGQSTLARIRCTDMILEICDLSVTTWERARLRRVAFTGCRCLGMQWRECVGGDLLFRECNLEGAIFSLGQMELVHFEKCRMKRVAFDGVELKNVVFRNCDLTEADLSASRLRRIDLRGSQIAGLRLDPTQLRGSLIDTVQAFQIATLLGIEVKDVD